MLDSGAVGVPGEPLHGRMHAGEEAGKAGDPEVAQLLLGTQGRPHLWGKLVVVVGGVPHKPEVVRSTVNAILCFLSSVPHKAEQIPNRSARVAPPLS